MKFIKWILKFILGIFLGLIILGLFNFLTDPFGVFGDIILDWPGYNITMNPRKGKIGYLDKNNYYENYNSFIIGSSKTSSVSPEQLNKYFHESNFYNMMMYGADMYHIEKTAKYLIDNYNVQNIVLHLGVSELITYNSDSTDIKETLHGKVSGENIYLFYFKHLFLNPKYGIDKIQDYFSENYKEKPSSKDVFIPTTGVYNKIKRDEENILNINEYVKKIGNNTFLTNYDNYETNIADLNLESIKNIKNYCEENNVSFLMFSGPNYEQELNSFDLEKVEKYFIDLSEIDNYWNFSGYNSVSQDPRFFYDSVHYRNSLGEIMLGKIFNDDNIYYPENFGHYITKENATEISEKILTRNNDLTGFINLNIENEKIKVPILMYHHLEKDFQNNNLASMSIEKFEEDIKTFKENGYTTIFLSELIEYAEGKIELPKKPLVITFDDGYKSNYEFAYPILKENNMKANINIIGWSIGRDTRINSDIPITPHFTIDEAKEMINSGVIEIGSHGFNIHEDGSDKISRQGIIQKENETLKNYNEEIIKDNKNFLEATKDIKTVEVFCYPYGFGNIISETILKEQGYKVTLLIENKVSEITKGKPETLRGLYRINAAYNISSEELINLMEQ